MADDPGSALAPPGWYADPGGGPGQRWWNGHAWSGHVQVPPTGPGPVTVAYGTSPGAPGAGRNGTTTVLLIVGLVVGISLAITFVAILAVTFLGTRAKPLPPRSASPRVTVTQPTPPSSSTVPPTPVTPAPAGAGPLYVSPTKDLQMWTGADWQAVSDPVGSAQRWTIGSGPDDTGQILVNPTSETLDQVTAETVTFITSHGRITVSSQEAVQLADGTSAMHVSGTITRAGLTPATIDLIIAVGHDRSVTVTVTSVGPTRRTDALRFAETLHLA